MLHPLCPSDALGTSPPEGEKGTASDVILKPNN